MQLHPNNPSFGKEIDILKQRSLIGLGNVSEKRDQLSQFSNEMKIEDIVLIKRGQLALALVEVVGKFEETEYINLELDWFSYRRKIKILEILKEAKTDFPQPRGTLSKAIDPKTKTYQYINDWYNRIIKNKRIPKDKNYFHLSHLFIENHKMFSNLDLSLTDKNNQPVPLIVLAGINGSGKTTLLEYINQFKTKTTFEYNDYIEVATNSSVNHLKKIFIASKRNKEKTSITEIRENIRYFPVEINSIKDTAALIIDYSNKLIKNNDYRPSEAYQSIRKIMADIFSLLELNISFSHLDEKDNVFFKNHQKKEFSIDKLSTGEKTLLSKVFSLYIGDYSGKIILIDEPETSLHPRWQNKIIGIYDAFCKAENSQIIIATHSPQIIGSVKNEYLKILALNDQGKIEIINDLTAYGRDIHWILTEIMGVEFLREKNILSEIKLCSDLLEEEKYQECEQHLDELENKIGTHDSELLRLRNILFFEHLEPEE